MKYLFSTSSTMVDVPPDVFGVMVNPFQQRSVVAGVVEGREWGIDNGAYTGNFDELRFFSVLNAYLPYRGTCLFVTAPDVMLDPVSTIESFHRYRERLEDYGAPIAFVAQDGQEDLPVPDGADVLFIGGSTEWKLSKRAVGLIERWKATGRPVHVGRVNSPKRIRHFRQFHVDTVDGTCHRFTGLETAYRRFHPALIGE